MPKAHHHHVRRVDNEAKRTYCWIVQVQCQGHIVIQYFSDGPYGGKDKALQAALTWRDAMLDQVQYERHQRWLRNCTALRRNNSSKTVGVGRYISYDLVRGEVARRVSWQAFWQGADGKRHSRKFSVNKYGEKQAKALACATRTQAVAERIAMSQGGGQSGRSSKGGRVDDELRSSAARK